MPVLLALTFGFGSGIFVRSFFALGWPFVIFILILAALCAGMYVRETRRAYSLGALFFLFFALGIFRAGFIDSALPEPFAASLRHRVEYEGVVVGDPDLRDANQRVEVRVTSGGAATIVLAVASRDTPIAVGDTVSVSGTLLKPEPFADESGRVFRYDKYLQRDGVRFILNYAFIRVEQSAPWYSVPAALAHIKHIFLNGLAATLPEPFASLAGGIVIGGKSGLGAELQNDFIKSGLVQIIVLSGYNVMIVAEWVMQFFGLFQMKRKWSALAGALAIVLFVGIAGASATALRAALMALIALYARATGRTYAAGRALVLVVFLMLLYNPLFLVYDPGFGLSVAATFGLIWLASRLEQYFNRIKNVFWRNALATTLAAQIAVLPLLLYDTGNLSLVAIPANLLTMPFMPLAMAVSALAGFAGMIFGAFAPMAGIVLAFPAYILTRGLIWVAQTAANVPFAAVTLPLFPFWLVVLAYAVLIYFASSKRFSTTLQLRLEKNASM